MDKEIKTTPVLLLTGYLGSGKTTLLNRILKNEKGIRFAVIVNDIGEVNIDASLIQQGGVVGQGDDSLVALQNGCICCTLKMDLVKQLNDIINTKRFDYIVIEASGICEPAPIAQTISTYPQLVAPSAMKNGAARLDAIVTVVDALRMRDEFGNGLDLLKQNIDEEDIENLVIQQIEFCNIVLLNKASEVSDDERERIRHIIHALQPSAPIIETDYTMVNLNDIINTGMFDYEQVAGSAGWIREIERPATDEEEAEALDHHHHHHDEEDEHHEHHHDDEEEHHHEGGHHHHHHHHHGEGEAEEYGIQTFVYYRRPAIDIHKFDRFVATKWPKNVIRAKGLIYFSHNRDMSFLFEQAGVQKKLVESGFWFATAPEEELRRMAQYNPDILKDWDETYGDRMVKIVFIGQNLDREQLTRDLDECLES